MPTSRIKVKSEECPYCGGTARLSAAFVCECWRRLTPWVKALVVVGAAGVVALAWTVYELREAAEWREIQRLRSVHDDDSNRDR